MSIERSNKNNKYWRYIRNGFGLFDYTPSPKIIPSPEITSTTENIDQPSDPSDSETIKYYIDLFKGEGLSQLTVAEILQMKETDPTRWDAYLGLYKFASKVVEKQIASGAVKPEDELKEVEKFILKVITPEEKSNPQN